MISKLYRECFVGLAITVTFVVILIWSYLDRYFGLDQSAALYSLSAVFNRVEGISVGSPVFLGGVPIGRVTDMDLLPDFRARVSFAIEKEVKLPTDTSVAIQTDGLLGEKFVRITPGGSEDILHNNDTIEYTQDAVVVRELLDLIISEAQQARTSAPEAQP